MFQNFTDWTRCGFCDETVFEVGGEDYEVIDTEREQPTSVPRRQYKSKVMVWACISYYGKSLIRIFCKKVDAYDRKGKKTKRKETVNSEVYAQTVIDYYKNAIDLFPFVDFITHPNSYTLVQDNAPSHSSKYTTETLKKNQITVLKDWPASSPDLNPIENLWSYLRQRIKTHCPKTLQDLYRAIIFEWSSLPKDLVKATVSTMPL